MDGQRPPNDPHRQQTQAPVGKEVPGNSRRSSRNSELNENGEMDVFGNDMRDQGIAVIMFLVGIAAFLLRERCTC